MHSDNGELLDHSTIPVVQMINEATFLCVLLVAGAFNCTRVFRGFGVGSGPQMIHNNFANRRLRVGDDTNKFLTYQLSMVC
jgi:hypothetical protein